MTSTQIDNALLRGKITKVDDSQPQQLVQANGRYQEKYGGSRGIPRRQNYGYTSNPPLESHAFISNLDGNPDKAMITHIEHQDYRTKNLETGQLSEYDMWGHDLRKKQDEWYWKVGPVEVWYKDGANEVRIKASKIILDGEVHAGGSGGVLVKRCDDSCATKVYAV